jgi:hypothetical protein
MLALTAMKFMHVLSICLLHAKMAMI